MKDTGLTKQSFFGYERANGTFGVRNHLVIISAVACINEVTRRIAEQVGGVPILHGEGCGRLPIDLMQIRHVLAGLGANPNVGAVLVVGLGCEGVQPKDLAADIAASGKPVDVVVLQEMGGYTATLNKGIEIGTKLKKAIEGKDRVEVGLEHLTLGIKCGASDATSGIVANPAAGMAADLLIAAGGTSIFCETTELIGAEHLLAQRAVCAEVGQKLLDTVSRLEREVERYGVDMRGGQPSPGNIAGGISSIEEKSLGAVCKAGRSQLQGVVGYGEVPPGKGLFFMDSPGREMEVLTGLASAGAQLLLFTTGRGAPQGFPSAPVIKVCANATTCSFLSEHIDVDLSGAITGKQTLEEVALNVFRKILAVASGELTKAEIIGYTETLDIYAPRLII